MYFDHHYAKRLFYGDAKVKRVYIGHHKVWELPRGYIRVKEFFDFYFDNVLMTDYANNLTTFTQEWLESAMDLYCTPATDIFTDDMEDAVPEMGSESCDSVDMFTAWKVTLFSEMDAFSATGKFPVASPGLFDTYIDSDGESALARDGTANLREHARDEANGEGDPSVDTFTSDAFRAEDEFLAEAGKGVFGEPGDSLTDNEEALAESGKAMYAEPISDLIQCHEADGEAGHFQDAVPEAEFSYEVTGAGESGTGHPSEAYADFAEDQEGEAESGNSQPAVPEASFTEADEATAENVDAENLHLLNRFTDKTEGDAFSAASHAAKPETSFIDNLEFQGFSGDGHSVIGESEGWQVQSADGESGRGLPQTWQIDLTDHLGMSAESADNLPVYVDAGNTDHPEFSAYPGNGLYPFVTHEEEMDGYMTADGGKGKHPRSGNSLRALDEAEADSIQADQASTVLPVVVAENESTAGSVRPDDGSSELMVDAAGNGDADIANKVPASGEAFIPLSYAMSSNLFLSKLLTGNGVFRLVAEGTMNIAKDGWRFQEVDVLTIWQAYSATQDGSVLTIE